MRRNVVYAVSGVLGTAAALLAGEGRTDGGQSEGTITTLLINILPWIVVFVFIWFGVLRALRKQTQPHQQRLMLHMDRIEQKYDRIIDLLERLVDRQARDEDPTRSQDQPRGASGPP